MPALGVVARRDNPGNFDAWERGGSFAEGVRGPVHGAFGRAYYPATFGDAARDLSFAVTADGAPVLLARCDLMNGTLGYFGMPLEPTLAAGTAPEAQGDALAAAIGHLAALAKTLGAKTMLIAGGPAEPGASPVGIACAAAGGRAFVRRFGLCDLTVDEAATKRSVRKSYRSLINWGRRNLRMVYVGRGNPDRELFESCRAFHAHVAGRVTRPAASWDAMFRWLAGGGGELALGYLDEKLVAATTTVDGTEVSYYASGVYDRERFDRPLAHWPVFDAIQRSRARGMRVYELGELPEEGEAGEKEFNIGYFKKGLAGRIEARTAWRWDFRA